MSSHLHPAKHQYRWVMLTGAWMIYCSFGLLITAMAPLVNVISAELGLSRTAMGSVLGAWPLIYVGASIPAGAVVDRFGVRPSLLIAAVVIALSGVMRAFAFDYQSLFVSVALFGLGAPLLSVGAPKLVSLWFDGRERGLAVGIYMTSISVGGILGLALTNSVVMPMTGNSWRLTLLVYAGFAVAVAGMWLLIVSRPVSRAVDGTLTRVSGSLLQSYAALIRVPVVQIVLVMGAGIFFFGHGLNNWLPEMLRAGGMSPVLAGYWAALPTLVGIVAVLVIPRLATGPRASFILFALFGCAFLSVLMLNTTPGLALTTALALMGVARSCLMPVAILVLMESHKVSSQNMGAASALFFTTGESGAVLGPLMIGFIADQTGGFALSLKILAALSLLLALLVVPLARAQRQIVDEHG